MSQSGSSYLSQSELPVTFGVGKRGGIDRVVIQCPSGRFEEHNSLAPGRAHQCLEEGESAPWTCRTTASAAEPSPATS